MIKIKETYEQQKKDSDIIFRVISSAAQNMSEANQMILAYIFDENFSRSGISHAITLLEDYFSKIKVLEGKQNVLDNTQIS